MSARRILVFLSVRCATPHPHDDDHREYSTNTLTGQVGKLLGERWKALNEKQRVPYESKAAADKKRYEDEKAAYNVSSIPVLPNTTSSTLVRAIG